MRSLPRMLRATLAVLLIAGAVAAACDDDDGGSDGASTPAPTASGARPTAASGATEAPSVTEPAGEEEVVGIVGAVSAAENAIEITRLSGADVRRIIVTDATRIASATGNRLELSDLRPSDRIIARGAVEGSELVASEVEVQAGVPGASPGG